MLTGTTSLRFIDKNVRRAGRQPATMRAVKDQLGDVVAAYESFSCGNSTRLIELLDADVVWSAPGARDAVGRQEVASRLNAAVGAPVKLVGVRRGDDMVVLEFTRPCWRRRNRRGDVLRSLFDICGEQAVWLKDGRIARIDSRERPR
jgi:hypothetical protein